MKFDKLHLGLVAVLLALGITTANAAPLFISPQGVDAASQVVRDPVPIGTEGFRLTYHSNGGASKDLYNPVVLIFAQAAGASAPTLESFGQPNPVNLTVDITLGGTAFGENFGNGHLGTFDENSPKQNIYEFVGLTDPNGSQNYTNWHGASGLTSWEIYVYTLEFAPNLSLGDWMDFSTTGLSEGSFVAGWGCYKDTSASGACHKSGDTGTPFTLTGYVTVPEPSTLMMFGMGLLGFSLARRKF